MKESVKSGLDLMGNAITDVAQIIGEKNKIRTQSTRLKQIIKNDVQTRDEAYIELGKYMYDHVKESPNENIRSICDIITRMNGRIEKASLKYLELQNMQNDLKIQSENTEKLKEAISSKATQIKNTSRDKARDIITTSVDKMKDLKPKKNEVSDEEIEQTEIEINEIIKKVQKDEKTPDEPSYEPLETEENAQAQTTMEDTAAASVKEAARDIEESPESFSFDD